MIAVTGGSGFLGRHILRSLQEQNSPYVALLRSDISLAGIPQERKRIIPFNKMGEIEQALQGASQILHLAGRINGSVEDLRESNSILMQRLVEAAKRARIKRIVYMSSVAAHSRKGPYGEAKWEAEEILKSSGIPYLIFRSTLLYGVGDNKNVATMERMVERLPVLPLLGGGKFLLQPLYVEDAVSVLIQALKSPFQNRTYNLAGPSQIALKEMMETLSDSLGKKVTLIPFPLKPTQVLVRIWSCFFPRTRLPVKQILELDQHDRFDIEETVKDFRFSPRSFREGVLTMKSMESICAG